MPYFKIRAFALLLILACGGLTYYNWYQLQHEGRYSLKLAAFGPVVVIGGVYMLFFPTMVGKPTTTQEKVVAMAVFGIGLVAGLINVYLMEPGLFGR